MSHRLRFFLIGLCVVLGFGFTTTPTYAQSTTWTAQYFNNTTLSGSPAATVSLSNLNINWGNNPPATGVNADDWTARFNTITYFNAGVYRFTVNADDAFRLYVHGHLLIDTFINPRPNTTFTADMTIAAGNGGIQVDFREYVGAAFLYVSWQQISVITIPPMPTIPSYPSGTWTAQYFNNTGLSGTPTATAGLSTLNMNWGNNAPATGVAIDNWTARFSTIANLNAGTYRFTINADDAFRLYVQNRLVLETFSNPRPNMVMTVDVVVPAGGVALQVDYREYIGPAFLYLSWMQVPFVPVSTPMVSGQAQLTINTARLNMRSTPFVADNIITTLSRGETYPVIGRSSNSSWYQIRVGQNVGWVSSRYVIATNIASVPIVNTQISAPDAPTTSTSFALRSTANLNIRSGPGTNYTRLGIMPFRTTCVILARNTNNTWWMITYDGVTGWVSSAYVALPSNINYAQIPVR